MQSSYSNKKRCMFLILTNVRLKKNDPGNCLELIKESIDTCCCIGPPDLETITMVVSDLKSKKEKKKKKKS